MRWEEEFSQSESLKKQMKVTFARRRVKEKMGQTSLACILMGHCRLLQNQDFACQLIRSNIFIFELIYLFILPLHAYVSNSMPLPVSGIVPSPHLIYNGSRKNPKKRKEKEINNKEKK